MPDTLGCNRAATPMRQPVSRAERNAQIIARLRLGESQAGVARAFGISRATVIRVAAQHDVTPVAANTAEQAAAFEEQARSDVVRNLRADFDEIIGLAVARIRECLAPGAVEANPVVLQTARWAIDKLVASADAKEATKAAAVGADKLVDKLAELTADDDEIRSRMESIEDAQDAVVARRQPHIVTPADRVTN